MGWTRREFLRSSAAVVSGGVVLTGCADAVSGTPRAAPSAPSAPPRRPTSSTRAPRRGTVRVGAPQGKPYAYKEGSDVTGQTVEVTRAVLENMGISQVDFTIMTFDVLVPSIKAKRVDLAGGMYLNQNLCQGLEFSVPDHLSLTALAVPPGNPKGFKTIADAISAGVAIAVMRDLPEHQYLVKAGVPARLVRATPTPDLMLRALTAGEADCAAFPNIGLREIIAAEGLKFDVTAGFVLDSQNPIGAAYGFPAKDDMLAAFSTELRKLHDSGEWLRISEPFGFTKDNVPPPDLTAERLCGG